MQCNPKRPTKMHTQMTDPVKICNGATLKSALRLATDMKCQRNDTILKEGTNFL